MSGNEELMLAQEQSVVRRGLSAAKRLEGEFGFGGEREGTLVLTNRRLVFACGQEQGVDVGEPTITNPLAKARLVFSDVEDLGSIPADPDSLFIPISSITHVAGHKGTLAEPKLETRWNDVGGRENGCEFIQNLTGRRAKNLNDWADVIGRLKGGKVKLARLPEPPPPDALGGRVLRVLGDLQEKGVFAIEGEVEKEFNLELDPDDVKAACDKLATRGLIVAYPDPSGDTFCRRRSPLGEDDLSS